MLRITRPVELVAGDAAQLGEDGFAVSTDIDIRVDPVEGEDCFMRNTSAYRGMLGHDC